MITYTNEKELRNICHQIIKVMSGLRYEEGIMAIAYVLGGMICTNYHKLAKDFPGLHNIETTFNDNIRLLTELTRENMYEFDKKMKEKELAEQGHLSFGVH